MLRPPPQRFVSFAPQVMIVDYELGKPSRYVYCPRWLLLLLQLECCACCRRKCVALTLPNAWLAWIMDLINCSSCSSTPAAAAAEHAPLIDWCAATEAAAAPISSGTLCSPLVPLIVERGSLLCGHAVLLCVQAAGPPEWT